MNAPEPEMGHSLIPRPDEDWRCPKCGNNGTNYSIKWNDGGRPMTMSCRRCGYYEFRSPLDGER
jgi:rubredoxin